MSRAAVLLLREEAIRPEAAAALAAAGDLAGEDMRTLILSPEAPSGPLPAIGSLEVLVVPGLSHLDPEALYRAERELVGSEVPDVLFFVEGRLSAETAARLAGALGYRPFLDLERCEVREGGLAMQRPVLGGKGTQQLRSPAHRLVLAFRSGTTAPAAPLQEPSSRRIPPPPGVLKDASRRPRAGVDLRQARVIVSGGRGLGGAAGFDGLKELADCLGGAVGASRAAVDEGWALPEQQVGLTGAKVAPELYLAVGISGASQHLMGMSGAQVVLAVNQDEQAPIVAASDAVFIADWHALWPHLRAILRGA